MITDAKAEANVEATKMIENAKASIEQEKQAALAHFKKASSRFINRYCRNCCKERISFKQRTS